MTGAEAPLSSARSRCSWQATRNMTTDRVVSRSDGAAAGRQCETHKHGEQHLQSGKAPHGILIQKRQI
jgi:hypothetical protein